MAAPSPPLTSRGNSGASGTSMTSRTHWPPPNNIGTGMQAPRQRPRAFKLCVFCDSLS